MSERRVTIRVEGIVQGVNYRQAARREAERLGISGFARNENDGSVTVEAEGETAAIARFIEWCQHGPASARVDAIEVSDGLLVGYDGFTRR
ncbi:MAG TPA: acylphosphatase [Thermomicrobiales bacterium]|nr:acylphosphatase [Thermomicrobiales bacterium]